MSQDKDYWEPYRRAYYWFAGTPADRPGGPWWFMDEEGHKDWEAALKCLKPFCDVIYTVATAHPRIVHDTMNIYPPDYAELFHGAEPEEGRFPPTPEQQLVEAVGVFLAERGPCVRVPHYSKDPCSATDCNYCRMRRLHRGITEDK